SRAEQVMVLFALPVVALYYVMYPIARIFVSVSGFILKYLFNVRVKESQEVFSRVDMEHFMKQTVYGHETEGNELNTELFENALNLVHTRVRRCMVPRKEVEAVDVSTPIGLAR